MRDCEFAANSPCESCDYFTGQHYGCVVRKKLMFLEELKKDTLDFGGSVCLPCWHELPFIQSAVVLCAKELHDVTADL